MLINLQSISKTLGTKSLYDSLDLTVQTGEKVGLVGRNGVGKSTLFGIIEASDTEFSGDVQRRRGLQVASTRQEHHGLGDIRTIDYVLSNLPEYAELRQIMDTYPDIMGDDMDMISRYTDALSRYGELGYYDVEERAQVELEAFQIDRPLWNGRFSSLSGGQKRLVELVKVTLSDAHLALIDEPTNHMDYVAKAAFIEWLRNAQQAVIVITHDRDVLAGVDRIIEIKDRAAFSFNGNYQAYLDQNGIATASAIENYEQGQKRLIKIEKQIREAKAKKAGWSGTADKTNPFMLLERRLTKERDDLKSKLEKPDFWIDQETVDQMKDKVVDRYDKYKARTIRLGVSGEHRQRELIQAVELSLGYDKALFEPVTFELAVGERMELHGRNGVGKSTLVKAIRAMNADIAPDSTVYVGSIKLDPKLVIGTYEQEIDERFMEVSLADAITRIYDERGLEINDQKVRQILSDYLFDPTLDGRLKIRQLSGGQKARFQLIAMLCHKPNLLILDEPTNHLDLPSIEELEKALARYQGAVLFISHDSYFTTNVGGERVEVNQFSGA